MIRAISIIGFGISILDSARCAVLNRTLRVTLFRYLYKNRPARLFSSFLVICVIALIAAVFVPLWVLLVGPLLYGLPHIAATIRYFQHGVDTKNTKAPPMFWILSTAIILLAALQLGATFNYWNFNLKAQNSLELTGAVAILGIACVYYRPPVTRSACGLALLSALALCSWLWPLETVGLLTIAHNFIGFLYWIGGATVHSERLVAISALGIFALAHVAIFAGCFDTLGAHVKDLPFADLSLWQIGMQVFPTTQSLTWWHRGVVAFAFGQAIHYFVWLRAIPEQYLYRPIPVTFRQSFGLLKKDFGRVGAFVALASIFFATFIWLFLTLPAARLAYFAIAGFHGYIEIAGLALLPFSRAKNNVSFAR